MNGRLEKCPDFHYARLGDGVCRLCKGGFLCKGGAEAPDEGELVPVGYERRCALLSNCSNVLRYCPFAAPAPNSLRGGGLEPYRLLSMKLPCPCALRYYRSEHDAEAHPCPNGTLGLIPGATSEQNCSPCPAGYMCQRTDDGAEYPRAVAQKCPAGYICLPEAVACPASEHCSYEGQRFYSMLPFPTVRDVSASHLGTADTHTRSGEMFRSFAFEAWP